MENHALTQRRERLTDNQRREKTKQVQQYIENRVMPLLAPLQQDLLKHKPDDIQKYCIHWLKQSLHNHLEVNSVRQMQSDEEPQQAFKEKMRQRLKRRRKGSRPGIIGDSPKDVLLTNNEKRNSTPNVQWPQQITINLIVNLKKCVFFEHLPTNQLLKLIQRMRSVELQSDQVVIHEGESGNQLFIVERGMLKCQRLGNDQVLKTYSKGEIFGELSLLYNNPRDSTVTALEPCRLFALARTDFAAILHAGMLGKLRECEQLVENIDIFQNLNLYERSKLYESMQVKTVGPQKYIIRQGQTGTCFYVVAEGQLVAYKQQNGQNKLVYAYKRGDYFGQIALLRNLPRQASVKTITDTRLYFINADCFSRVLGPLEAILKRNQQRYARIAAELNEGRPLE